MKTLQDTFQNLHLSGKLSSDLLTSTEVLKINKSKTDDRVFVYLKFRRLVDDSSLKVLAKDLETQFFHSYGWKVQIEDTYDLPDYSVSDVLNLVWDRFVRKMAEEHPSCKGALERAKWAVNVDSDIHVTIDGYSIIEQLSDDWSKTIRDNLLNRFQLQSSVTFDYTQPKRHIFTYQDPVEKKSIVADAPITKPVGNSAEVPFDENPSTTYSVDGQGGAGAKGNASGVEQDITASGAQGETSVTSAQGGSVSQNAQSATTKSGSYSSSAAKGSLRGGKGFKGGRPGTVKSTFAEKENDPNLIYGRSFSDESKELSYYGNIEGQMVLRVEIMAVEVVELRNREKSIIKFDVTDYTDSISCKIFVDNDDVKDMCAKLSPKTTILIKGLAEMDNFEHEVTMSHVAGIMKYGLPLKEKRVDTSELKRVELHAHTKSSEKDAICETQAMLKLVESWGHSAIAITDHGNVQSFPDAYHYLTDNKSSLKVLYGMEGYLVDDTKVVCSHKDATQLSSDYVVFQIHATNFTDRKNELVAIGAVRIHEGQSVDTFTGFCNPGFKIPYTLEETIGIRNAELANAESPKELVGRFLEFAKDCYLVAFNAEFAISYIKENCDVPSGSLRYVDTLGISRYFIQKIKRFDPEHIAKEFNLTYGADNEALIRATEHAAIYAALLKRLANRKVETFFDLSEFLCPDEDTIKKMEMNHVILIAKNETGRVNLYRMVSDSNLKYFQRRPRIPKSLLEQRREGIIVGSACSEGELYKAVLNGSSQSEIERLVKFYDYLEVQPLGNDNYLLADEKHEQVKTVDDLIAINRKIIALGDLYQKPVCATGDVHFIDKEDAIYRQILQAGCGYSEREEQPPLYLRTTEEMLKEFDYLGSEKAVEIVITNPNMIADSVEVISPVRPDKCPPVIENSDQDLRDFATQQAKLMYGDPLPEVVQKRLDRELNAIISNGYAVMYAIAHKLIEKSLKDGYLVGSRGSVGSSFAATMYNITEVNPLPPHYRCPNCKYSDFESETVKKYAQNSGWDMPDADCPKCGTKMIKDGYNIPFETFMGFKGNKEPDIDLNFSDEYQSKAHAYAEVIFGAGQTFKAGTVGTVADKTAEGYVFHYGDDIGVKMHKAEVKRLATKITGVKQSTGQHPGGIIVLPLGEDINTFTPVQHPADKTDTNIVTTHFDYHSIDHNLLKLDILGHLDPTMIRMLNDLTGVDPRTFPLDVPEIMGIFKSTEPLGIKPEDIHGVPLGVLGIPEFGTDNAIQMLLETKPQFVSDLIRISGLAHGTNVWHGNAEVLIKEGTTNIQTCICTRDDIMMYLIEMGVENETAFNIMEQVRKGKVAKGKCKDWPQFKEMLKEHNVPDWYLWSCEHIEYMFPKAHAAAYVMMALRIAYCKVFYPLAYYCAYFSIRASGFDFETMCMGQKKMKEELERLAAMKDISAKEELRLRDIKIVEEMYARGFSFAPIDIYKVDSIRFQMVNDKQLMPSLTSIDGMGAVAADSLVEAAKAHKFTSLNDIKNRTKISGTMLDKMSELGILADLPKNDQISFFDTILQ